MIRPWFWLWAATMIAALCFIHQKQADGAIIQSVHTDPTDFISNLPPIQDTITETFEVPVSPTMTPDLEILADTGSTAFIDNNEVFVQADNLLHFLTIFRRGQIKFGAFGLFFDSVPSGVFAVFGDDEVAFSRIDPNLNTFFVGIIGDLDSVNVGYNTGGFLIKEVLYAFIPEPSSIILMGIGLLLMIPILQSKNLRK